MPYVRVSDWSRFISEVKKNPKDFATAIIKHLHPSESVKDELRMLMYLCDFCWEARIDECWFCHKSVCDDHRRNYDGDKTRRFYSVCPTCQDSHEECDVIDEIKRADQELFDSDPEEFGGSVEVSESCENVAVSSELACGAGDRREAQKAEMVQHG